MLGLKAIQAPQGHYDVAIIGGGLAGLTLARRARPRAMLPGIEELDLEAQGAVVAA